MSDGRFSGDMDRNEVEIDLNKFMDLINENNELKQKIFVLETDGKKNPHQKWIHLAQAVDSWRIFPRAFLSVYIFLLYYSTMWFMTLEEPSLEQSGLISIIVGAGAAWFGLYAGTSGSSKSFKGEGKD
jgi:MFS superfamily sulfate permease-like transporter